MKRVQSLIRALLLVLLMAASLSTSMLFAEMLVRFAAPQTLILRRPDVWYGIDGLGWDRAPNLDTTVNFGGAGPVRLITDDEGNRIGTAGKVHNPEIKILAIGDSFVEALQVDYEQTMTWLLQESVRDRTGKRTEIQCAGVGGWNPNQYLIRSKSRLRHSAYDLQLVFVYLGNDIEISKVDALSRREPAPYHYVRLPRTITHEEIVAALLYPANDWLETSSQAFILFRNRMQPLLARLGLTAEQLPWIVSRSTLDNSCWDITVDILREIEANGAANRVPTLFVLIPPDYMFADMPLRELGYDPRRMDLTQPYRLMSEKMTAAGLRIVDLTPAFQETQRNGTSCYGTVDTHLNAGGHRVAAAVVLPYVIDALREARGGR